MVETVISSATILLIIAVLTESVTEVLKQVTPKGVIRDRVTYFVSIVVGVALAFAFDLNVFGLDGIGQHITTVAVGLIVSRGANYVNGFMKSIGALRGRD